MGEALRMGRATQTLVHAGISHRPRRRAGGVSTAEASQSTRVRRVQADAADARSPGARVSVFGPH